jgi:hypothetical protein
MNSSVVCSACIPEGKSKREREGDRGRERRERQRERGGEGRGRREGETRERARERESEREGESEREKEKEGVGREGGREGGRERQTSRRTLSKTLVLMLYFAIAHYFSFLVFGTSTLTQRPPSRGGTGWGGLGSVREHPFLLLGVRSWSGRTSNGGQLLTTVDRRISPPMPRDAVGVDLVDLVDLVVCFCFEQALLPAAAQAATK